MSYYISFHNHQYVNDTAFFFFDVHSHLHFILDQQDVSDTALHAVWLYFIVSSTGSEYHCILSLLCSLTASIAQPTVCEWHSIFFLSHAVSLDYNPTSNREWGNHFIFTMQPHCISSHDQQEVSDTSFLSLLHFISWPTVCEGHYLFYLLCSLITFHPMTNRKCVIHSFLYHAMSLYFIHSMANREWVTLHFSFTIQSDPFHPMMNRKWVSLHVFFTIESNCFSNRKWVALHFFSSWCSLTLLQIACEWYCIWFFSWLPSHHISQYDQNIIQSM